MAMTSAQYAEQLRALLPPGRALAAEDGSVVANLLAALAIELSRVDANGDTLLEQIFPDATTDFLADWERITGLPDDCAQGTQTDAERRTAVMQKLAANSSPTIDFLVGVAADLGYNITIIERGARRVDTAVCGGFYGTTGWNFVWQIDTPVEQAQTRRAGDPCGGELSHWINPQMPCKIGQHRPAGTLLQLPWPMPDVYKSTFPSSPLICGVGFPINFDVTTIGGVAPLSCSVDYLPEGVVLFNGTAVSGAPTKVQDVLSRFTVTDANGRVSITTLFWRIAADPIIALFEQYGAGGAYFDASDLSVLYQDAAGSALLTATGQPIGLIKDKSGNGNDASQGTTANCPTLQKDANGLYKALGDGVDDYMQFNAAQQVPTAWIFWVGIMEGMPPSSGAVLLDGGGNQGSGQLSVAATSPYSCDYYGQIGGQKFGRALGFTPTHAQPFLIGYGFNGQGTSAKIEINGALSDDFAVSGNNVAATNGAFQSLFSSNNPNQYANAAMSASVRIEAPLNDFEVSVIAHTLGQKAGMQL